jgi:uncharacterized membrane protein
MKYSEGKGISEIKLYHRDEKKLRTLINRIKG